MSLFEEAFSKIEKEIEVYVQKGSIPISDFNRLQRAISGGMSHGRGFTLKLACDQVEYRQKRKQKALEKLQKINNFT